MITSTILDIQAKDVVLLLSTTLIGFFIAWFFFERSKSKTVMFWTAKHNYLYRSPELAQSFQLKYKNRKIENPIFGYFVLWNGGNTAVKSTDFPDGNPVGFQIENSKIIECEIYDSTRSDNDAKIGISDNTADILFSFLNPKDIIKIRFIADRVKGDSYKVKIKGNLIGLGKVRYLAVDELSRARYDAFIWPIVASIMSFSVITTAIFVTKQSEIPLFSFGLLIVTIFMLGLIGILIYNSWQSIYNYKNRFPGEIEP